MCICNRCDFSCLEIVDDKYCLKCQKGKEPSKFGICDEFYESEKEDVSVDIDNETWNRLEIMAEKANMSPEDFASKLIVQRIRKVLGI